MHALNYVRTMTNVFKTEVLLSSSEIKIIQQKIPNHGDKWRNQEWLKGLQPPFAKSLKNIAPKFKGLYNPTNSKPLPPQQNLVARLIANLIILNSCPYKLMKITKVLLFCNFSWSTFGFRLLPKVVKLLKKMYINLVPSALIECNTTPPVCPVSEKIILFCTLSSINCLIRNLKVLIKLYFLLDAVTNRLK